MSDAEHLSIKPNAQYLSVREFARIVGASERTVWRWIKAGTIPSIKIGGTRRVIVSANSNDEDWGDE